MIIAAKYDLQFLDGKEVSKNTRGLLLMHGSKSALYKAATDLNDGIIAVWFPDVGEKLVTEEEVYTL